MSAVITTTIVVALLGLSAFAVARHLRGTHPRHPYVRFVELFLALVGLVALVLLLIVPSVRLRFVPTTYLSNAEIVKLNEEYQRILEQCAAAERSAAADRLSRLTQVPSAREPIQA